MKLKAIDEVVSEDYLIERAIEIANTWSQWGSHTKEATKHLLLTQNVNDFETHLKHEQTLIEAAGTTASFAEGIDAFLSKRKPDFSNINDDSPVCPAQSSTSTIIEYRPSEYPDQSKSKPKFL